MLAICEEIREVTAVLDNTKNPSFSRQQSMSSQLEIFYGMEKKKVGEEFSEVFFVPSSSYPWTNQLLKELDFDRRVTDSDGMFQLPVETVFKAICTQMKNNIKNWIVDDKFRVVEYFSETFTRHPLHQAVVAGGHVHQSLLVSQSEKLGHSYFRLLSNAFDMAHHGNTKMGSKNTIFTYMLAAVSPQATCYIPATFISTFSPTSGVFKKKMINRAKDIFEDKKALKLDKWLEAWRINSLCGNGSKEMKGKLMAISRKHSKIDAGKPQVVYKRQRSQDTVLSRVPPMHVLTNDGQYKHVLLLWLTTCKLFHNSETLNASKALHHLICNIASDQSIWNVIIISI